MSGNPYESTDPQSTFSPPVSEEKPTSVRVLGIINIVFSAMALCGLGFTTMMFMGGMLEAIPQDPNMPNPTLDLWQNNAGYRAFMIASMVLGLIFAVALFIGGIGLIKYKRYGRSASIAYAWYAIVSAIVGMVVNYFFIFRPMLDALQNVEPGNAQQGAMVGGTIGGIVGGVIGGCAAMIYPCVLLYFMSRPNVKRSLG